MKLEITNDKTYASGSSLELKWLAAALTIHSTVPMKTGRRVEARSVSECLLSERSYTVANNFKTGLVPLIQSKAKEDDVDLEICDLREMPDMPGPVPTFLAKTELRDYQVVAAESLLEAHRGVLSLPTGSGKTEAVIAALRARKQANSTLILVHSNELMKQWVNRLQKLGYDSKEIGIVKPSLWKPMELTVAMTQTLFSRLHQAPCKQFLNGVTGVIQDECHKAGDNTHQVVYRHLSNAFWRWGLSATPFEYGEIRNWKAMGVLGPTVFKADDTELVKDEFISQVIYHYLKVHSLSVNRSLTFREQYERHLLKSITVRSMISDILRITRDEKVLVIVNEVEHGKFLASGLPDAEFVHGAKSMKNRELILEDFKNGSCRVLISSPILDFGIDFKDLPHVVLAGGLESVIRLVQRIGRARRGKLCHIYDFNFEGVPYLEQHSFSRFESVKRQIPSAKILRTY